MQQFVLSSPADISSSAQLVDSFRYLHPSQERAYTCWSTMLDCRKTNHGTRIDCILVSPALVPCLRRAEVWAHVEGSDHCPVYAEIELKALQAAAKPPSLCSSYFSELKQQKLSTFLSARAKPAVPANVSEGIDSSRVSRKRSGSSAAGSVMKVRKSSQAEGKGQTLLLDMFHRRDMKPVRESVIDDAETSIDSQRDGPVAEISPAPPALTSKLSEEWRGVFSGPPKPPLCRGHQEPCVMRTVRKAGPNKNRQFWSCARPGGSKDDAAAKCNHFGWVTSVRGKSSSERGKKS